MPSIFRNAALAELPDLTIRQLSKRTRHRVCHCRQAAISLNQPYEVLCRMSLDGRDPPLDAARTIASTERTVLEVVLEVVVDSSQPGAAGDAPERLQRYCARPASCAGMAPAAAISGVSSTRVSSRAFRRFRRGSRHEIAD